MDHTEELFRQLTEASGVPGYEQQVRAIMRGYLEPGSRIEQDKLGSIIAVKSGEASEPRVMLAAHLDEIGFMVTQISEEGFLRFVPLGGWWDQVMLAQRVVIKTAAGDVHGVIGAKPPHLLSPDEAKKLVEKRDMYIDIGASSAEQARSSGVRLGDPVIPVCPFTPLSVPQVYMGKAWDDRLGCALMVQAVERLARESHPNTLYAVGTVQEEVGSRGAKTSVYDVNPDVAIILDVDIAGDVPGIKPEESSIKLAKGPTVLLYDARMIPNLALRDLVISTADEEHIPLQFSAMPGGATDGAMVHIHNAGVPTVVIGIPTRHIHSHASIIHRADYEHALQLVVSLIQRLDGATVRRLAQ